MTHIPPPLSPIPPELDKALATLVTKLVGPAADQLGAWLGDRIFIFRNRNTTRTLQRALSMVEASRREPSSVPLRTLLPVLEGAAIEDDSDLAELWAALLANAALAGDPGIRPIYAATLRQLAPSEALALRRISDRAGEPLPEPPLPPGRVLDVPRWGVLPEEIQVPGLTGDQLEASLNVLVALGLIEHEPPMRTYGGNMYARDGMEVRLTALGRQFMVACTPPSAPDS